MEEQEKQTSPITEPLENKGDTDQNNAEVVVEKRIVHTYSDDVAKALDTTEASVVQELLIEGREREEIEKETEIRNKQKVWYKIGGFILTILTLSAIAYTVYHYMNLTVEVEPTATVGVFPSSESVISENTNIRALMAGIKIDTTLEKNKPTLIPIVKDQATLTLLTPYELFSFFEARASEPFLSSFSLIRLGVMSDGIKNIPFIIGATKDAEISAKELLIAEPDLIQMLYIPLDIDISNIKEEVGKNFVGDYMYNIPVRIFEYPKEGDTKGMFFYARVTDDIVVFTTSPEALKAIYDSLIKQQR
jgi:hypothetical protein